MHASWELVRPMLRLQSGMRGSAKVMASDDQTDRGRWGRECVGRGASPVRSEPCVNTWLAPNAKGSKFAMLINADRKLAAHARALGDLV